MREPPLHRRVLSAALLLCHVVVVGLFAPLADTRLERDAGDGIVHIEAEGDASCPPGHDHLHCQFCQHLGVRLPPPGAPHRVPALDMARAVEPGHSGPVLLATSFHVPLGPRAPPVA